MKSKKTKKALTGSVLALVLCFVMLLGTTFAWFTDTASTKVNTIQAGNLKVELLDAETGESLEGQTLNFKKAAEHENEAILWEPGCTYELQPVVIQNTGNLALKYKVEITGLDGNKLAEAIDWTFTVGTEEYTVGAEKSLAAEATDTLTIKGHMRKEVGNEYQGKSLDSVAITVYATQDTVEFDSSTNQYDVQATYSDVIWDGTSTAPLTKDENDVYHITNAAQFVEYMNSINKNDGKEYYKVVLDSNIDLGGHTYVVSDAAAAFSGTFDGQNHTVSNYVIKRDDTCSYTGLFSIESWAQDGRITTLKNLTVKNGTVISKGPQVSAILPNVEKGAVIENCHAINCTVIGEKKVGAVAGYVANGTVKDCSAENCNIYASNDRANQVTVFGYDNGGTFTNNTDKGGNTMKYGVTTVSSAAELKTALAAGGSVVLMADIDLNNEAWTPVGDSSSQYTGTFDGNGHTIYNLTVTEQGGVGGNYAVGFFGWVAGTVKNLTIDGANVTGNHWVGAIAGYVEQGTIENCTVKNATVKSEYKDSDRDGDKAGALVGYLNAGELNPTIKNCTAENCQISAVRDAGQIVGAAKTANVVGCNATNVTVSAIPVTVAGYTKAGQNITNGIIGSSIS